MRIGKAFVVAGLWLSAAGLGGCDGAVSPEGRRLLQSANAAYHRGDNPETIQASSRFLQLHPRAEEAGEAHYLRGLARLRTGQAEPGQADLQAALKFTKRKDLLALVHARLGEMAYAAGQMPSAEAHYRAVLDYVRLGAPPADQAMYRLGCVLQRGGRWSEADQYFDRVMYLFDGTETSKRAERRVRAVRWSIQAGAYTAAMAAEGLRRQLQRAGVSARVDPSGRGDRLMHLVRVGSYRTYEAAQADLNKVKAIRSDAFVTAAR